MTMRCATSTERLSLLWVGRRNLPELLCTRKSAPLQADHEALKLFGELEMHMVGFESEVVTATTETLPDMVHAPRPCIAHGACATFAIG